MPATGDHRRAVLVVALLVLAAHLFTIGLYGFHRDELYLIASGRRLGQPGVNHATPAILLSRASELLAGLSPFAQRIPDAICGALTVLLAGACAERLGGDRRARVLAAVAVGTAPIFFFSAGVHGTNALDQLAWTLAEWIFLGLFDFPARPRGWLLLGVALGAGFLAKPTILFCAVGVAAAILATPLRSALRSAGPWLCAAVTLLFLVPTALWQRAHGWPLLDFVASSNAAVRGRTAALAVILDQVRLLHPVGFALAALGIAAGLRRAAAIRMQAASIGCLTVLAAVLAVQGKPYYASSVAPLAIAAGSVVCVRRLERLAPRVSRALAAVWLGSALLVLLGTLPLLPVALRERLRLPRLNPELLQFADWEGHVARIADAWRRAGLADGAPVLTGSYGTAAAIELFGAAHGLPGPISAANDYYFWTAGAHPDAVLALGVPPELLAELFEEVTAVATIRDAGDHDNRFDFPRIALACRRPKQPLAAFWRRLRRFD